MRSQNEERKTMGCMQRRECEGGYEEAILEETCLKIENKYVANAQGNIGSKVWVDKMPVRKETEV